MNSRALDPGELIALELAATAIERGMDLCGAIYRRLEQIPAGEEIDEDQILERLYFDSRALEQLATEIYELQIGYHAPPGTPKS
jgi:hypothetical protein